ncbi:MAG: S-layer homology domain-containing protein, partial [Peptococcaceae bacterium]|nr:S-layer homology domain-containing protein [Peptococcaceae bacterium]
MVQDRLAKLLRTSCIRLLIALGACLAAAAPAAAEIAGLEGHWAGAIVEAAEEIGLVEGYPGAPFKPDSAVTRAEFIKMAAAAGGLSPLAGAAAPVFKDAGREHWAYPYVRAATVAGVVYAGDYPDGLFKPDEPVTREEIAVICSRLLAGRGVALQMPAERDGALTLMAAEGILRGYPDGSLGEKNPATRAEACAVALRLKMRLLEADAAAERRWLAANQSPAGYVLPGGGRPDIVPYFSNIAYLALCADPAYRDAVKKYLEWVLARLNDADRWGLAGTIYDYLAAEGGELISTGRYDSADSYAATALSLAAAYYKATGDADLIRRHYRELSQVAAVITTLQDADGLVWSRPNLQIKYLMDNCECYRGLADWSGLLADLGFVELAGLYRQKAEWLKRAIETRFWAEEAACFAWAVDQEGTR